MRTRIELARCSCRLVEPTRASRSEAAVETRCIETANAQASVSRGVSGVRWAVAPSNGFIGLR